MNQPVIKRTQLLLYLMLLCPIICRSQKDPRLNTARNCTFMKPSEREMIYEINVMRNNPPAYADSLSYWYEMARLNYNHFGKGNRGYSLQTTYESINGVEKPKKIDTVWHNEFEEELKAIKSLINDLKTLRPLSILQPDQGIYNAARKHAMDEDRHNWTLGHRGSDGSWPWDRIRKYSPKMEEGNENLAGKYPEPAPKDIVIQLLIDAGIPGYGHRYNLLNPDWTHVACYDGGLKAGMFQWIQDFGKMKN